MKKLLFLIFLLLYIGTQAQENPSEEKEKTKKGFNMAGIPIVAFDEDMGFRYGAAVNLYDYGDGQNYPKYNHSLFLEWSKTTKGGNTNLLVYDGLTLIPKTRVKLTLGYLTEQAKNFYGFNGYESLYNNDFETTDSDDYISRMYYRHARKLFVSTLDFQGKTRIKNVKWMSGFSYYNFKIGRVDIDKLNEDQETDNLLPNVPSLYDNYIAWGIIPEEQADGGQVSYLKFGAIYDSRDNEANPNKGIWSEILMITAPKFALNDQAYSQLLLNHRQYIGLIPNKLSFAYKLSYQTKISGDIPFYILPFITDSKMTKEGLGGARTLRGILSNRIVGDGVAYANFELRSKLYKTILFNQNFYFGCNLFSDMGLVTQNYEINYNATDTSTTEDDIVHIASLFNQDESLHLSYGSSMYFVINNNFVVAVDYGIAAKKEDGKSGLYIGLDYMF